MSVNLQNLKSNFYSYYFFLGHLRCETKCFFFTPMPSGTLASHKKNNQ